MKIRHRHDVSGLSTLYGVFVATDQIVKASDGSLVALSAANWPLAKLAFSDSGTPYNYFATMVAGLAAGYYQLELYLQLGATAAIGDTLVASSGAFYWTGDEITPGTIPSPPSDDRVTAYLYTRDAGGAAVAGVTVKWRLVIPPESAGSAFDLTEQSSVSDANGLWTASLLKGGVYKFTFLEDQVRNAIVATDATSPLAI